MASSTERCLTPFEVDVEAGKYRPAVEPKVWQDLDDDVREAMVSLVSAALRDLADSVETWLPQQLALRGNSHYSITISWENGTLNEQVLRLHAQSEHDRQSRISDLLRILQTTSE